MTRLALASLRSRLTGFLGTFVAAALSVALLGGAAMLLFSVLTANPTTHRFDAASVMVSGDRQIGLTTVTVSHKGKHKSKTKTERLAGAPALPLSWGTRIASVPGVKTVVGDYSFQLTITAADGALIGSGVGHGWASAGLMPFTLRSGTAPQPGQVAVDPSFGLRAGDRVRVLTRTGARELTVSGVVAQKLDEQASAFVSDEQVAAVSGLPGPTAFGVRTTSADAVNIAAAIRQTLGIGTVYTGPSKVRADLPSALPDYIGAISIFGFVIGITAFATVFVLTGTVALTVRQRLRELALLRATGATPRQLWRLLSAETLLVTFAAAVAGAPLSVVVAQVIAGRFRDLGAVPRQFAVQVNVGVLLAAVALTAMMAQLSASIAARRAVRIAPVQALQESVVEGRSGWVARTLIALACTAGAVAVLTEVPLDGPFGMGMTFISSALLLCALAAAGQLLVRMLSGMLSRIAGTTGTTGWLAGAFTRAETRRVAAVAVPLALMVGINAPMLLNSALSARLAAAQEQARIAAATSIATGALPLSQLQGLAGDYAATMPTRLIVDEAGKPQGYTACGVQLSGAQVLDLGFTAGSWHGGGLAASAYLARANGWHVGETVRVWLPDGYTAELPLAGIFQRNRGFGDLVAPAALVAAHDPRGLVTTVASRGHFRLPGMHVTTSHALSAVGDDERQGAWEIMIAVSLGFTAIAVVNTFAVAAAARRSQFTQLRLLGATPRQIGRMTAREALLTVAVGLGLGVAVTTIVVAAFSTAQDGVLRLIVDPAAYGGLLAAIGLLGLAAGTLPARLVLRSVRPVS